MKPVLVNFALIMALFSLCACRASESGSCTARDNEDGSYTVSCADGTEVTFSDGAEGPEGADGSDGATGPQGPPGADEGSCTVQENGDGTCTMSCEDGTDVTFTGCVDG